MADPKVTVMPDGPYIVEGGVPVHDGEGKPVEGGDKPRYALCRCGASKMKPFCDGTHSTVGFKG